MLMLLLFYQLFVVYAATVVKRPEKSSENRTTAFNDYPEYDNNIWSSAPLSSTRRVPSVDEYGNKPRFGVKRYPQLNRTPDYNSGYNGPSSSSANSNGEYLPPNTMGYPDVNIYRPYNALIMGSPRIRTNQGIQMLSNSLNRNSNNNMNSNNNNNNDNNNNFYQGYPSTASGYSYASYIQRQARRYPIMMYTMVGCPPCQRAKHLLAVSYGDVAAHFLEMVGDEDWQRQLQVDLHHLTGQNSFPSIFICGQHIGGSSDLFGLHQSGQLRTMLNNCAPRQ